MFNYKVLLPALLLLPFIFGGSTPVKVAEEDNFTISNYTSFSPGTQVKVNIYGYNNRSGSYKFALLKITDVKRFYSGLLRTGYNFDIVGREILLKYTRKVRDWESSVGDQSWNSGNVDVGVINEPGIYIVQAMRKGNVAYCSIVVSDHAIIYKASKNQVLAFATNVKTSAFVNPVKFTYANQKKAYHSDGDKDGIAKFAIEETDETDFYSKNLLFAEFGNEILVSNPYLYFGRGRQELTAYTYTNQPVYRPGQEVFFKSIIREKGNNEMKNFPAKEFDVTVKSPKNKEVYHQSLKTNETGTLSGSLILDEEADLGSYQIILSYESNTYYGSFDVEEYKKPEYLVKVEVPKNNFSSRDKIEGSVKADYFFGSPVTKGAVTVNIYKQNFWRPWWYYSEYSWFYRSFEKTSIHNWREMQFIESIPGELNADGEFKFSYEINEDVTMDYQYTISAEVTDASRRAVSGSSTVYVTRGSFSIFTQPDRYFTEKGKPVTLRVNAADFSEEPVVTDFKVVIYYPDEAHKYRGGDFPTDSISGRTDKSGKAHILYVPKTLKDGYYNYIVSAKDEKGRLITAHGSFYYGEMRYYQNTWGEGVEIMTDKDSYNKGDTMTAYIFVPAAGTEFLLSYEANNVFFYKRVVSGSNSIEIREKLDDRYAPSFNISVVFMKNGQYFNKSKQVGVLAVDKFLSITVLPDKKQYKPGDSASYKIVVKDYKGNPVEGVDLSAGLIDESIYSIKEETAADIKTFFYAPSYTYIMTNNSYYYNYSTGRSRKALPLDKNFFGQDAGAKGREKLYGKITGSDKTALKHAQILLSGEKQFYTAYSDTSGNYVIENVIKGDYELYVIDPGGNFDLISSVKVSGDKKHDIESMIEQAQLDAVMTDPHDHGKENDEINVRGGRVLEMSQMTNGADMKMEMNSKSVIGKVEYKSAEVRSNFVDAGFWAPVLITNKAGSVTFRFKMPDNLTTWRATIRGVTAATHVGQEINKTITRKDLIVRMETPRFFREGDELTVSTIVHNYLNEKKTTKISFKTDNLKLVGSTINTPGYSTNMYSHKDGMYELTIDKNTELRIDWKVLVDNPLLEAKLTAEALTNEESDAVELKVPILPKGIREVKSLTAEVTDKTEENITFRIPDDVDIRSAKLTYTVTPSLAGTMLKALDELAGYPYGCVEQTMSRFLPTVIAANTFKDLKLPIKSNTLTELPKMVEAGLKRLYNFQHEDGGWGWWTNDESNPYMTAYVIYGLSMTEAAGYHVDEGTLHKGSERLAAIIEETNTGNPRKTEYGVQATTFAYMLFALSTADKILSSGSKGEYASLILKKSDGLFIDELNPYAVSLLTLTMLNIGEKEKAAQYAAKLGRMSHDAGGFVRWRGKEWHYSWQDDEVQTTAFAVKALINAGVHQDKVSSAVKWLMLQKRGFAWRSTQETAAIMFALTDYLKTTDELNPDYRTKIYLNGELLTEEVITTEDVYSEPKVIHRLTGLRKGDNIIRIVKEGKGKLYFSGVSEYFSQNMTASAKGSMFKVKREYFLLKQKEMDGRIVYTKEEIDDDIISGQDILVKTKVSSSEENLQYFMLEDMLPSGFEVVKDENRYEIEGENNYPHYQYWDYHPWRWFYADKEYRDEKVAFFVTNATSEMEFSYIIKAQIPGKYSIMPSQASLMYYPEINGNSSMREIVVVDK